ncbi:MAG: helix-turn-helix domain-containing protein [Shewanellaceae bacterium]|nr:helix-turn-helix domain-containing protein [Shewanellaceae bacterium]
MLLITPKKAQKMLANQVRQRRLHLDLTQAALASRSGVALSTLRKFEQQGTISLGSFLKLQWVLGGLADLIKATDIPEPTYTSIEEVLQAKTPPTRQRGKKK